MTQLPRTQKDFQQSMQLKRKAYTLTEIIERITLFSNNMSIDSGHGEMNIKWNNGFITYVTETKGFKP